MRIAQLVVLALAPVLAVAGAQSNITPRGVATNGVVMDGARCEQTVMVPNPGIGSGLLAVVLVLDDGRPDTVEVLTGVRYAQPLLGFEPFQNVQMPETVASVLAAADVYQTLVLGGAPKQYKFTGTEYRGNQSTEFFSIDLPLADALAFLHGGGVPSRLSAGRYYAELEYSEPFITELRLGFGAHCLGLEGARAASTPTAPPPRAPAPVTPPISEPRVEVASAGTRCWQTVTLPQRNLGEPFSATMEYDAGNPLWVRFTTSFYSGAAPRYIPRLEAALQGGTAEWVGLDTTAGHFIPRPFSEMSFDADTGTESFTAEIGLGEAINWLHILDESVTYGFSARITLDRRDGELVRFPYPIKRALRQGFGAECLGMRDTPAEGVPGPAEVAKQIYQALGATPERCRAQIQEEMGFHCAYMPTLSTMEEIRALSDIVDSIMLKHGVVRVPWQDNGGEWGVSWHAHYQVGYGDLMIVIAFDLDVIDGELWVEPEMSVLVHASD